jgi:hypothetical protein
MAIIIRSAQTLRNGVTLKGNNAQYVRPADPLGKLFELDASNYSSGTTLLDISGNSRHATIYGNPTWDNTDAGGCFVFDSDINKHINVIGSANGWGLANSPAQATFSVWAKVAGPGYYQHIAGWRGGINFWFLILTGSSITEARFDNGPVHDINIDYNSHFGAWAQTTFVVDAANGVTRLYINGTEVGYNTGVSGNFGGGASDFTLGDSFGGGFPLNGKIGGAMAYSRTLTDAEVISEFNRTKSRYGL